MHLGAWPGGSWLPWRAAPLLLCSCSCLVSERLPQEWSYLSFHLFTCTMGFAPIKWTCTAFIRPRQLTDRAILAIRQTQEKKRPVIEGHNFKEDWDKEGHINHPKRSETALTTDDIHQLQQATHAHNELRAPMNQFMERQFANQEPLRNNLLIPTLEVRINKAAKLRGDFAQMVHTISRNFTIRDTNQIIP